MYATDNAERMPNNTCGDTARTDIYTGGTLADGPLPAPPSSFQVDAQNAACTSNMGHWNNQIYDYTASIGVHRCESWLNNWRSTIGYDEGWSIYPEFGPALDTRPAHADHIGQSTSGYTWELYAVYAICSPGSMWQQGPHYRLTPDRHPSRLFLIEHALPGCARPHVYPGGWGITPATTGGQQSAAKFWGGGVHSLSGAQYYDAGSTSALKGNGIFAFGDMHVEMLTFWEVFITGEKFYYPSW